MRNQRTARYRPWLAAVGGAALLLVVAAPTTFADPWPVSPNSDNAEIISQLFWFTLVLAAVVFVLVEGLLIYSSLRFRRRGPIPDHEPPQIHGNTRLEVMWAIVPALILIGLFGITVEPARRDQTGRPPAVCYIDGDRPAVLLGLRLHGRRRPHHQRPAHSGRARRSSSTSPRRT